MHYKDLSPVTKIGRVAGNGAWLDKILNWPYPSQSQLVVMWLAYPRCARGSDCIVPPARDRYMRVG